jgi:hypothetical protein
MRARASRLQGAREFKPRPIASVTFSVWLLANAFLTPVDPKSRLYPCLQLRLSFLSFSFSSAPALLAVVSLPAEDNYKPPPNGNKADAYHYTCGPPIHI